MKAERHSFEVVFNNGITSVRFTNLSRFEKWLILLAVKSNNKRMLHRLKRVKYPSYETKKMEDNKDNKEWISVSYDWGLIIEDKTKWVDGRWYVWRDKYGNEEKARMKADCPDHFFPNTELIQEENIVAFRELTEKEGHTFYIKKASKGEQ